MLLSFAPTGGLALVKVISPVIFLNLGQHKGELISLLSQLHLFTPVLGLQLCRGGWLQPKTNIHLPVGHFNLSFLMNISNLMCSNSWVLFLKPLTVCHHHSYPPKCLGHKCHFLVHTPHQSVRPVDCCHIKSRILSGHHWPNRP